jgi:ribose/xylose/arabinose/galactoside ABC-type transport system permease subunit
VKLLERSSAAGPSPQAHRRPEVRTTLQQAGAWPALLLLLAIALVLEPAFFGSGNMSDVFRRASILGIVTIGQVLVLMTAGIDLSVGAVVGITAVALAEAGAGRVSLTQALGAAVIIALCVGLVNGLLVARRNVPPVVATFGMFVTLEGLRVAYTRGTSSGSVPELVRSVGQGQIAGVPWSTVVWVLATLLLALGLRRSVLGRRFTMAGANARMAALSGISVTRMKVGAYVASALLAVAAGVFFAGYIGYVDRFIGRGMDLDSIAAALLGGTTFTGGKGSFVHAAGGALLIVSLLNLITVSGLNVQLQLVAKGIVLITAVALQTLPNRTRTTMEE